MTDQRDDDVRDRRLNVMTETYGGHGVHEVTSRRLQGNRDTQKETTQSEYNVYNYVLTTCGVAVVTDLSSVHRAIPLTRRFYKCKASNLHKHTRSQAPTQTTTAFAMKSLRGNRLEIGDLSGRMSLVGRLSLSFQRTALEREREG
ncbi:hypothetical protein EVAR_47888_1 [Eumeta japonica]|uniref:Uncharacterized protein n=1 Tax=Eumeta variegata TaxID=151549 RepID=A0A4C1YAM2_EUMVA|nr:hypothetical protein EVAR_47888_1 [Eumeta japonica]